MSRSPKPKPRFCYPDPIIILTGCRPVPVPRRGDGSCGVCGGATERETVSLVFCCECSAASKPLVRLMIAREIGRRDEARAAEAAAAERQAADELDARHETTLTERERRRIWNGQSVVAAGSSIKLTNLTLTGRKWLTEIDQLPDWSLILDKRGQVVGRYVTEPEPKPEPELETVESA